MFKVKLNENSWLLYDRATMKRKLWNTYTLIYKVPLMKFCKLNRKWSFPLRTTHFTNFFIESIV